MWVDDALPVRDWPPELMRQRNWLWGLWRETARKYAFDEYDAPILEEESLYKRKAGEGQRWIGRPAEKPPPQNLGNPRNLDQDTVI